MEHSLTLVTPFDGPNVEWEPTEAAQKAAWELYVELLAHVPCDPYGSDGGSLREAVASLDDLFQAAKRILRDAGPLVSAPDDSFGEVMLNMISCSVRPVQSYWSPRLADWEARRPPEKSVIDHENGWYRAGELRYSLDAVYDELRSLAQLLQQVRSIWTGAELMSRLEADCKVLDLQ